MRMIPSIVSERLTENMREITKLELHRCTICGTRWLLWPADSVFRHTDWNLLDKWQRPGSCCDNVAMGDQIEHLRDFELASDRAVKEPDLDVETERRLREYLWLNHGHQGQYGDDGEMQCGHCAPMWDYRRAPLAKVVTQALKANYETNLKRYLKRLAAEGLVSSPARPQLDEGDLQVILDGLKELDLSAEYRGELSQKLEAFTKSWLTTDQPTAADIEGDD